MVIFNGYLLCSIVRQPPRRMFPQIIPISQPIRSQRYLCLTAPSTAHVHAKFDMLIWFEICELAPSGDYIPVVVDHHDETPCRGTFLMHQGIQRRIRISILHDQDSSVNWKELRELVVGRVRAFPECPDDFDDDEDESVLSLSLFPGEHLEDIEGRAVHRYEAAWDTSLHNSILLNRVTPNSERIFLTLSAYLEVSPFSNCRNYETKLYLVFQLDQCTQPAIITKDLCLVIYGRDARTFPRLSPNAKALKHLLSGAYRNADCNHQSAVYELLLKRAVDTGSPGVQRRQRRVLDTSGTYVRGEENLRGWQPKGDSLIFDHQWELEKMRRIELVERVRHVLMVRDKLASKNPTEDVFCGMTTSSSRMNLAALTSPSSPVGGHADDSVYEPWGMTDRERELCSRCVQLIQTHVPSKPGPTAIKTPTNEYVDLPSSNNSSPELLSPDRGALSATWGHRAEPGRSPSNCSLTLTLNDPSLKPVFVPELEEIRVSSVISRKGVLYLLDEKSNKWTKRFLVVRRPYLFLYR